MVIASSMIFVVMLENSNLLKILRILSVFIKLKSGLVVVSLDV